MNFARKLHATLAFILVAMATTGRSQVTVGYGTESQGGQVDLALTSYVFLNSGFGESAVGLNVSSWSFYTGAFETSKSITPLLWEYLEGSNYTLKAIGGTVSVTGNTAYFDLPFDLQSGSNLITSDRFFFGWKDGTPTSANDGVISFDYFELGEIQTAYALTGNSSMCITSEQIDTGFDFGNQTLGQRTYRFSATAIPEPATVALTLGLTAVAILGWQRMRSRPAART